MKLWYEPTERDLAVLDASWCASYSGGKDSTSLVTWVEWLRRSGRIVAPTPGLVLSDTGVEDPRLMTIAESVMARLRTSGWACTVVRPSIDQRLYNRILGLGLPPVHPGGRKMRWCSRATKIDPMRLWRVGHASDVVCLTGLRLGESGQRDDKLRRKGIGCQAGGECGMPEPDETTYAPLLNWKLCQLLDWLNGYVERSVRETISDFLPLMAKLIGIYQVRIDPSAWEWGDDDVSAARFGCIGCPAISDGPVPPRRVQVQNGGPGSPLNEMYAVWVDARHPRNRLIGRKAIGPIRMAARTALLDRVLDIQRRAGVVLVRPEDEAWIRQCWADKRYPRGWSEADETTSAHRLQPLFEPARAAGEEGK